jgi:hypothetical protein
MPNAPLRTCPTCGGKGFPSFCRSGGWLNKFCPDWNGPVDADDFPDGHECDCGATGRWCRVEYKRLGEGWLPGQERHIQELHGAFRAAHGRELLCIEVLDEGQTDLDAQVGFRFLASRDPWRPVAEWASHRTTLRELGRALAYWVWYGRPEPVFILPPPPACGRCGCPLPRMPQQTIPIDGVMSWVCVDCFHVQRGALKAAREQAEEEARVMPEAEAAARAPVEAERMERLV